MVRLFSNSGSNEYDVYDGSNDNSINLMRKMNNGGKFSDESGRGFLRNIHSFLKPRRRTSNTNVNKDTSTDTGKEEEEEEEYEQLDQSHDEDMDVRNFDIPDGSSSPFSPPFGFSQSDSTSPLPAVQKGVSTLIKDTKANGDNTNLYMDRDLTIEEFLHQPRSLYGKCNSASVSPCKKSMGRHFRHSSLNLNRKDRKSMRNGSKMGESLRKMSTMDSPARDFFVPPQPRFHSRSNSISPTAKTNKNKQKAMESRLSHSQIPHFYDENCSSDNYPRITAETLQTIMEHGIHKPQYDSFCVIDCRFEYEFRGGHINNALSICSREGLELEFIQEVRPFPTLLIFYCEFSAYRSPLMASHLRNCDRIFNYDAYPNLFYPDILILEGGYKSFFDRCPHLCHPCSYVRMNSTENLNNRDQELDRFRQDSKKLVSRNSSLNRLPSISTSTSSIFNKQQSQQTREPLHPQKTNNSMSSPIFKYEPPPKHPLLKYGNSPFLSSDESSCSSSRISFANSPNLNAGNMLTTDALDLESCYSFEDGESTFTTPPGPFGTPTMNNGGVGGVGGAGHYNKHDLEYNNNPLNPVKKSLFHNILLEEENEKME